MLQQFYPQVSHNYRYELNKDFHLAAAHYIPNELAGACEHLHGHTYFINVTIAGNALDDTGFLVNFKDLKTIVHKRYDHTVLNDHDEYTHNTEEPYMYPTTEIVASTIWELVQTELNKKDNSPKCLQVLVRETPTSYVIFKPSKEQIGGNLVG